MSSSYITDSVVLLKPGYRPHLNITALFSLGIITEDIIDDDQSYSVNVTLFLPLFDDCLTFCCRIDVTVQCDAVAIRAETVNVINSDYGKSIKLSDEHFSALIRYLQRETNILSEDESCGHDHDESDSEEGEDNGYFTVDSSVILKLTGRSVRSPLPLDW